MKNILILSFLFSFCLTKQVSASVCGNLHLAYQKKKVGKRAINQRLNFKEKSKRTNKWLIFWIFMGISFVGIFVLIGLLGFQLTWWLSILMAIAIGLLILLYWFKSDYNFHFGWITVFLMCITLCVISGMIAFIGWVIFQGNLGAYLFYSTIVALFMSFIFASSNLF